MQILADLQHATTNTPHRSSRDLRMDRAEARLLTNDQLATQIDVLGYTAEDPGADEGERVSASDRIAIFAAEMDRRLGLFSSGRSVADPRGDTYAAWREAAAQVRQRADIVDVFDAGGHILNRKAVKLDGTEEWVGPCPVCGGHDRLIVRRRADGRAWCRQCRWSADAIAVAASLIPECGRDWREAIRYLAAPLGIPTPTSKLVRPAPAVARRAADSSNRPVERTVRVG